MLELASLMQRDQSHHTGASLFLPEKMAQLLKFSSFAAQFTAVGDVLVDVVEPLLNPVQRFSKSKYVEDEPAHLKVGVLAP
ncbi:Uncharacterised protein [Burkholderia cepacia]|uniref:Uncharacterized protein n=1 Tax=Burkholderia cepacia TaxID=292 RepID=A0AAE8NHZ3_BURCE|nr:hypothetical protein CSX04_06219 [Burkholderia cepacia]SPV21835.1 Uncharacterised protein [Burkholderia cepacia]